MIRALLIELPGFIAMAAFVTTLSVCIGALS